MSLKRFLMVVALGFMFSLFGLVNQASASEAVVDNKTASYTYETEASIGDLVWLDSNQNGLQDNQEPGIPNVPVHLLDDAGRVRASMVTDGNGRYGFTTLRPGDYAIQVDIPADYIVTVQNGGDDGLDSDIDGNGRMPTTTLDPGEDDLSWDAGLYQVEEPSPTLVKGVIYCDANQNQMREPGEAGLEGIGVALTDNGTVVEQMVSNQQGNFQFSERSSGNYDVQVSVPNEYVLTGKRLASFVDGRMDVKEYQIGLFGPCAIINEPEAAIGDFVWLDSNQNGIQDDGEYGVAGVTVILLDDTGHELRRMSTNSSGQYLFSQLTPANYQIQFVPPEGYKVSTPNQGSHDEMDSDMSRENGRTAITTIEAGETDLTWDAGIFKAGKPLSCARFNLDLGRSAETGAGVVGHYEMIEIGSGNLLASWEADAWWADSGWIEGIELSFPEGSWVEVYFYPEGVNQGQKLEVINPASGTEYGWLAPGMCHAIEVQFPIEWVHPATTASVETQVDETAVVNTQPVTQMAGEILQPAKGANFSLQPAKTSTYHKFVATAL